MREGHSDQEIADMRVNWLTSRDKLHIYKKSSESSVTRLLNAMHKMGARIADTTSTKNIMYRVPRQPNNDYITIYYS